MATKREIDEVLTDLMADWEIKESVQKELRQDPVRLLEGYFKRENIAMDTNVRVAIAQITAKVRNSTDQQLEEIRSKGCGGPRI